MHQCTQHGSNGGTAAIPSDYGCPEYHSGIWNNTSPCSDRKPRLSPPKNFLKAHQTTLVPVMEEPCSVNSPRRILSFSRNRKENVSPPDSDQRSPPGFGVSGEHGPKLSEVYGFVGSITTVVATAIFLMWAYFPDHWLHSMGIYYFPNRYWALVIPTYLVVTITLGIGFYVGLNFLATPPPTSLNSIFDEFSREPLSMVPCDDDDEYPIEPISDIGIDQINGIMFDDLNG